MAYGFWTPQCVEAAASDTDPLPCHATVLLEIANGGEDE